MPANKFQVASGIINKLNVIANLFANNMRESINNNNLPKEIEKSIEIGKPQFTGGTFSVEVRVGGDEGKARAAVAYEYGSGLQRTRGTPGKYRIPKEGSSTELVAFPLERSYLLQRVGQSLIPSQEGTVVFAFVEHPGVAARPFVAPSVRKTLPEAKKILSKEIKAMILLGTEPVTVIHA
jgi:hypothetical protein